MKLEQLIYNKRVLFIPIVSMRSYETDEYNVFADGNINRVLYKIKQSNCAASVLLPNNVNKTSMQNLIKFCERLRLNTTFYNTSFYGKNAKETRENDLIIDLDSLGLSYNLFDYIIVEPTHLCYNLLKLSDRNLRSKLIFWNLVSNTDEKVFSFTDPYEKINRFISENCTTFYAVPNQQIHYESGYVDSDLFDVMEERKTIFVPFRLSDSGYHAKELKEALNNLSKKYNFTVLFTDVNDSNIWEQDDVFKKVSSDRDLYYTILKSKPIIPMLEDTNNILHMSLFEFKHYNCKMVMFKQAILELDNVLYIDTIEQLEEALEKWLI